MEFTQRIEVDLPFDDTVARVTDALLTQGFGVLTRVDVQQTLREKLGAEIEPQVILGACNPQLAHQALLTEPRVAALLPCNVVVRTEGGRTVVEALDPMLLAEVPGNADLRSLAEDAAGRIRSALAVVVASTR